MNEKKNIDRLFQEKFKDFEMAPQDAVWDRISESLPNKKKKRRVIPIWWQIGGVAATIALLLTIGFLVFDSDENLTDKPVIVETEQNDPSNKTLENTHEEPAQNDLNSSNESQETQLVETENTMDSTNDDTEPNSRLNEVNTFNNLISNPRAHKDAVANRTDKTEHNSQQPKSLVNNPSNKRSTVASNKEDENLKDKNPQNDLELKSTIKNAIVDPKTAVAENSNSENKTNNTASEDLEKDKETLVKEDPNKTSIIDAIAENTNLIDEKEKEDEQNRWSIQPNVAPVYFSSLGQGSTIHNQFSDNSKSSEISMSYGISGSYAISDKLRIRAGINRVNLNYATSDVIAFSGANTAARNGFSQGNINFKNGNVVSLVSLETLINSTTPEAFNTKITGDIDQRFGFVEVPLELEYRLLDKKFGLNVIGGFSTFFLNQNEIYADIDGNSTLIGEASNINSTSFSANFGLGLDYNLSKRWNINLEPQFKYQINTFNNTFGNFRPFFIGVYTGVRFKF
ncbi:hypothetical protein [Winogradskyella tangerina]|uniref:hypothetical protein n=1 Tax=Winogradskyella tangerina TaxID=2023240 RepID=UPI000DBE610A|nr:hypothetical protein [Winogradskyella tangerina]